MWKFLVAFCLLCCVETDASNLLDSDKLADISNPLTGTPTDAANLTFTNISNPLDSEEGCLECASNFKKIAEKIKDTDKVLYTEYQKAIKILEKMTAVNKALAEQDKVLAEQEKEILLLKEENESLKAQIEKLKKPS
jgi:SMC interacting uncharacterized protein involved in chromosome segregation